MGERKTKELCIKLTRAEQKRYHANSITFRVLRGTILIGENWGHMDEIYGSGVAVGIPKRVWAEALPWLLQFANPNPSTP